MALSAELKNDAGIPGSSIQTPAPENVADGTYQWSYTAANGISITQGGIPVNGTTAQPLDLVVSGDPTALGCPSYAVACTGELNGPSGLGNVTTILTVIGNGPASNYFTPVSGSWVPNLNAPIYASATRALCLPPYRSRGHAWPISDRRRNEFLCGTNNDGHGRPQLSAVAYPL
jgi:hypothetical protein